MKRRISLDLIYNPESFSTIRDREQSLLFQRSRKPFEEFVSRFDELISEFSFDESHLDILARKIENTCRKIVMMSKAGAKTINCEKEIMLGQDRELPTLIWDDEIELLYHLEAMILFGRSALDIAAYVFSTFLLKKRTDSYNKFCQSIKNTSDLKLLALREIINSKESIDTSWLNILRGSAKGRSLRDKIAHQTVVKIEYEKIKSNDEDLYCHVVTKGKAIPLEEFVKEVIEGVIDFCLMAEDIVLSISTEKIESTHEFESTKKKYPKV